MYSIKPGRGPSLFGAIMGLVVGVPFALFWISGVSKSGAPGFFVFFGVAFLIALLVSIGMGFYNATSRNRISQYDITSPREEPDPLNRSIASQELENLPSEPAESQRRFCPFCGARLGEAFRFCPDCGKPQSTEEKPS